MNLLDLLFPKTCLECGKTGQYICDVCNSKVSPCGINDSNYSVFKYEGVIRKAITSLKYKFATDIADELVEVCFKRLKSNKFNSEAESQDVLLVPIPLHRQRENFRGFNQSEILGKKIAEKMSWKFIPDLLIRNKNTKQQVGLERNDRLKNLSNVFIINPNYVIGTKYNVLVFDDVYTTGTTINEAKKVLKQAGFKNVKSMTIAT